MEAVLTPILVALIGGPLMFFLQRRDVKKQINDFDGRNTDQHAQSMTMLSRIDSKLDRVDTKVDRVDGKVDRLDDRVTRIETRDGRRRTVSS